MHQFSELSALPGCVPIFRKGVKFGRIFLQKFTTQDGLKDIVESTFRLAVCVITARSVLLNQLCQ
jgi:hypothetical protein